MSKAIFDANPSLKKYFKTSDGEPFYKEGDANLHAKSLEDRKVTPVFRPVEEPENDVELPKYNELMKAIKEAATAEAVDALIVEGESRKTVLEASAKRKTDLTTD
jgi:hypothetical protein